MPSPTTYPTLLVPENGTFVYNFNITSDGSTLLPLASIISFTLTIIDCVTGLIVNSQSKANALNTNGVVIATGGQATWTPAPLDNSIIEANPNAVDGFQELHEAVFQWTWLQPVTNRPLQLQTKVFVNVEKYAAVDTPIIPGAGASQVTINLGYPGLNVWISTDPLGQTRAAGTLITDFRGFATFQLVNGAQYYLWVSGDGFNPINGQPFIAVQDTSFYQAPPPPVASEDDDDDDDGNT